MAHINRFNAVNRSAGTHNSIAWEKNASALLFAALLVVCSIAVGCSKDKPQPVSTNQIPTTQSSNPAVSTDLLPASSVPEPAKKAPKKVARKRPSTVTYSDKTYGVSFQYPRNYALETGDAANELIASGLVPMDFTQPGGTALAAVSLPATSFPGTDFESGLFNVSVNKNVSAEDCGKFSVPQPDPKTPAERCQILPRLSKWRLLRVRLKGWHNRRRDRDCYQTRRSRQSLQQAGKDPGHIEDHSRGSARGSRECAWRDTEGDSRS
jgi:hypothetical protein